MTKSWEHLIEKYSPLFHEIQFGIECGLGWYELVESITVKLQHYNENCLCQDDWIWPLQIKEKYGELRYYTSFSTDDIYEVIELATAASRSICEECGQPGEVFGKTWIYTRCKDCREKLEARSSGG